MKEIIIRPLEGFEVELSSLTEKKEALKVDKDLAVAKALQEVDEKFKGREALLDKLISMVSVEIEVEIPDIAEEVPLTLSTESEITPVTGETVEPTLAEDNKLDLDENVIIQTPTTAL